MAAPLLNIGDKVTVKEALSYGARDYVGKRGKVHRINRLGAHCVMFKNGDFWFYNSYQLRRA